MISKYRFRRVCFSFIVLYYSLSVVLPRNRATTLLNVTRDLVALQNHHVCKWRDNLQPMGIMFILSGPLSLWNPELALPAAIYVGVMSGASLVRSFGPLLIDYHTTFAEHPNYPEGRIDRVRYILNEQLWDPNFPGWFDSLRFIATMLIILCYALSRLTSEVTSTIKQSASKTSGVTKDGTNKIKVN